MAYILIVDDEETGRLISGTALQDAGHEVMFAPNGDQALAAYESKEFDLVITDLVMPNTNGLRLIEQIREHDELALIIAVSGVSPEQLDRALKLGAAVAMRKPFDGPELVEAVAQVLRRGRTPPPTDLWA